MSKKKQDYYELLHISKSASAEEIKAAYRKSAMKYHPDRNQGDKVAEEKFKMVSEAYEVLSDGQKRQIYDRFGHEGLSGQGYHGPQDVGDIFSSFGSIFEEFFGFGSAGGSSTRASRGADLRYDLVISFKEAVFGIEKEIEFEKNTHCAPCKGSGQRPGSKSSTCKTCRGQGQIRRNQGFFSVAVACHTCQGQGTIIEEPCKSCRGSGQSKEHKKISVKIPAGVDTGLKLRVSGEGEGGANGGPFGDLYVFLHVEESHQFARDGFDVICKKTIGIAQAALGCELKVETLDGEKTITVPAGSQHGQRIVLAGEGIPHIRGVGRGDFYVELHIHVPTKLNKEQRELLEQFAHHSGESVSSKGGGSFFQRIFES